MGPGTTATPAQLTPAQEAEEDRRKKEEARIKNAEALDLANAKMHMGMALYIRVGDSKKNPNAAGTLTSSADEYSEYWEPGYWQKQPVAKGDPLLYVDDKGTMTAMTDPKISLWAYTSGFGAVAEKFEANRYNQYSKNLGLQLDGWMARGSRRITVDYPGGIDMKMLQDAVEEANKKEITIKFGPKTHEWLVKEGAKSSAKSEAVKALLLKVAATENYYTQGETLAKASANIALERHINALRNVKTLEQKFPVAATLTDPAAIKKERTKQMKEELFGKDAAKKSPEDNLAAIAKKLAELEKEAETVQAAADASHSRAAAMEDYVTTNKQAMLDGDIDKALGCKAMMESCKSNKDALYDEIGKKCDDIDQTREILAQILEDEKTTKLAGEKAGLTADKDELTSVKGKIESLDSTIDDKSDEKDREMRETLKKEKETWKEKQTATEEKIRMREEKIKSMEEEGDLGKRYKDLAEKVGKDGVLMQGNKKTKKGNEKLIRGLSEIKDEKDKDEKGKDKEVLSGIDQFIKNAPANAIKKKNK